MAARKPGSSNRIAALHRRLSAHPRTATCGLLLAAPAAVLAATLVLSDLPRVGRITARAPQVAAASAKSMYCRSRPAGTPVLAGRHTIARDLIRHDPNHQFSGGRNA